MRNRIRKFSFGSAIFAALVLAAGASAQPLAWNQQKVTAISIDLVHAVDALLADPELDSQQSTAMQQREHRAAISTARQLRERVDQLRRRLGSGYTRDETEPFWDQIEELRGDIQAYARNSWLPETVDDKADRVGDLLDQLARYYAPAE